MGKGESAQMGIFMELFLKAVAELGKRFDQNIWLDAVDIALPGAWGEGYKLENYPKDLFKTIFWLFDLLFLILYDVFERR